MNLHSGFFLRFRLKLLRKILLLLSIPFLFHSCRNVSTTADSVTKYVPRSRVNLPDTLASDSVKPEPPKTLEPVYYDPTIQVDYGIIMQQPDSVYFEPYPVTEYGVVHPDLQPDE